MNRYYYFTLLVLPLIVSLSDVKSTGERAKSYVCTPCGLSCDSSRRDKPGSCEACNMDLVDESTINFKNIDFNELCALLKASPDHLLLDVRSPGEFNNTATEVESFGRFKGAINIDIEELGSRMKELDKHKGKPVIVYCSHSHRSPRASYLLALSGFQQVVNVKEGVSALTPASGLNCLKDNFIPFKK
jgi:rhodanese-related sulfurtransferase